MAGARASRLPIAQARCEQAEGRQRARMRGADVDEAAAHSDAPTLSGRS